MSTHLLLKCGDIIEKPRYTAEELGMESERKFWCCGDFQSSVPFSHTLDTLKNVPAQSSGTNS